MQKVDPLRLCSVRAVRQLISTHRLRLSKAMGQSFIVNRSSLAKVSNAISLGLEDSVFEIGTGFGTLTANLALQAKRVVSLEKDFRLFGIASSFLKEFTNVVLHHADALKVDWQILLEQHQNIKRWKFVSNLPYSVSKPILMLLIQNRHLFSDAIVTVQREVAQRIVALPGTKSYGVLSVAVQLYADVKVISLLSPKHFYPPPEVWSAAVKISFLPRPKVVVSDEKLFLWLVEGVLNQRRKTILNSVSHRLNVTKEHVQRLLSECAIDPKRRGETLSLPELARLTEAIYLDGLPVIYS